MPYGGTAPELDPPDEPPDEPPEDEPPEDDPPDDEPPDDDELEVSSAPPHAAMAVALANKIAARVATRPVGGGFAVNAGSSASQNGQLVSLART